MITVGFSDHDAHPIAITCRSEEGDEVSLALNVNAAKALAASLIHMVDAVERDEEASNNAKAVIKKVEGVNEEMGS